MTAGMLRKTVPLFGLLALLGCEPAKPPVHPVVRMAQFDLQCPRDQITYTQITDRVIGVRGCGKQTKYAQVCRQHNVDCQWFED